MQSPTLSRAIEGFLIEKSAKGLSEYTLRNYEVSLRRYVEWAGNPAIHTIASQDINKYFEYLQRDFRITHQATTPIEPRKLTAKTVQNEWGLMSTFRKYASVEFDIPNPFNVPRIRANTKPIDPLSQEVVEKLLRACNAPEIRVRHGKEYKAVPCNAKRNKAMLMMLLDTGMRASELCDLTIGNVDFDLNRVYIASGKGDKARYVYMGRMCQNALWKYLLERFPNADPPPREPLFAARNGFHHLTRNGLRLMIEHLGKQIGVDGIHPHRFRHTFAIQFLRNGGNIFELQQLLGHSSLDMVRNYVRVAQLDLEEAVKRASPADNWRLR